MAYTISSILAIYFVLWWVVLFVTLPFGVRSQVENDETIPGTDPGAPIATLMARKLIWTTVISAVIFAVAFLFYWLGYFRIDRLTDLMGFSHWNTRSY
jgi:predicted secreted protein